MQTNLIMQHTETDLQSMATDSPARLLVYIAGPYGSRAARPSPSPRLRMMVGPTAQPCPIPRKLPVCSTAWRSYGCGGAVTNCK